MRAIGVDGCRAGWVVAAGDVDAGGSPGAITIAVVRDFAAVLALDADRIAVDIPIGLPDEWREGGRACDVAARRLLGWGRGASVFPAPPRAALALTAFDDPRRPALGLTQQAFGILPRVAEVDALLSPGHQDPDVAGPLVMECHPEVVFSDLNGGVPLPESKHAPEGLVRRRMLLEDALGRPLPVLIPRGAAQDDVLDALACLWVAAAPLAALEALPSDGVPRDRRGLAMQIWRRDPVPAPVLRRATPRRRPAPATPPAPAPGPVERLLEALGPMPGIAVGRLQVGDLCLEGERCRVVVEIEADGGATTLARYWPLLRDGLDDKRFLLVHLFRAATPGDFASHRRTWRFLADRMAEDLEARGRGPGSPFAWEAELVVHGPAVAEDPFPAVAARIRGALGLEPRGS